MFEKPSSVCLTTLTTEKRSRENQGSGACDLDRDSELRLRLKLNPLKHPLRGGVGSCSQKVASVSSFNT